MVGKRIQTWARSTEIVGSRRLPLVATAGADVDVLGCGVDAISAARAAISGDFMASSSKAEGNAEAVVARSPRRTFVVEKGMLCGCWR
jgi:hypothetical protein